LRQEQIRRPDGLKLNVGSASQRFDIRTVNLDLLIGRDVDLQADLMRLPLRDESVESIICTGVLEHVTDPHCAVREMFRVLRPGGRLFVEVPFMQTLHASPKDFSRWTPDGLRQLLRPLRVLELHVAAGPASALAWMFQETMALFFSLGNELVYKIALRVFGYLAMPLSWMDIRLERHPMAYQAACSYAVVAQKSLEAVEESGACAEA
jgi:SAM-dependent methyltransferase